MLIDAKNSLMLVIDMQEKLMPLVINDQEIADHCLWLLRISQDLGIPCLTTEQYPKALGSTVSPLKSVIASFPIIAKMTFSAMMTPEFEAALINTHRRHIIMIGIETHVCMLQTAIALQEKGFQVYVVLDCTSARHESDKQAALERMRQHGISLVTREMVVYEWLRQGGTPEFKRINEEFIK